MKTCKVCSGTEYDKSGHCRACRRVRQAKYAIEHPERLKAAKVKYTTKNRGLPKYEEARTASRKKWRLANPEKHKEIHKRVRKKNPGYMKAYLAGRKIHVKRATPSWANKFFIQEAYSLAALRTKVFGFPWHVDHIIPLRGKLVCGFHVETNLRVIPGIENLRKTNTYDS